MMLDDEIADELKYLTDTLCRASELLLDINGTPRPSNFIQSSHFIINEVANELTLIVNELNLSIYKSKYESRRQLKREREYREDDKYFGSLKAKREAMESESQT